MSSYYSVTLDYTMRSGQELRITDQIHKEITGAALNVGGGVVMD